ncbi:hypothetical protein ILUMI_01539 [Ignelater luminosus]|uniref:Phospholipase A2 n=1 Tax=Ignelater luminosus TaxID=2038154 RepID=A0A8K0GP43_IGNLU|nr:hypothetical protein ILUMI_01539 [Ignelater luminosus]
MYFLAKTFLMFSIVGHLTSIKITWENDVSFNTNETDFERMPNWLLIFPGTKWCGAGNISNNDNDLGEFSDTDKCCRTHDFCDDFIEGYQTKHNLTNPSFYTRLNCKCDKEFYKCLKSVNSKPSMQIGHIYFTALGTQCFKKEYPVVKCINFTYLPRKKCVKYEYNTCKEKVYQWFDVPNF